MTASAAKTQAGPFERVELAPSYWVPLGFLAIAVTIAQINIWTALPLALFGLFLTAQAATLRLRFTETALEVVRGNNPPFKTFPYAEWQNWRLYWTGFPILLYFKEVNNIHFLPILFDPKQLQDCLEARCQRID